MLIDDIDGSKFIIQRATCNESCHDFYVLLRRRSGVGLVETSGINCKDSKECPERERLFRRNYLNRPLPRRRPSSSSWGGVDLADRC